MDAFRKQLDALMGANRNGDVLEVKRNYWDRDVCRLYLTGLCPHDLFQLTVSLRVSWLSRTRLLLWKSEFSFKSFWRLLQWCFSSCRLRNLGRLEEFQNCQGDFEFGGISVLGPWSPTFRVFEGVAFFTGLILCRTYM